MQSSIGCIWETNVELYAEFSNRVQPSCGEMVPSKTRRSESRRSSILKAHKPRQPLQNVNLNSSFSNENSSSSNELKNKRRVSFAEKKHIKEFCHSTEQGTVWDNTYEEHDFSLKGSFMIDQNTKTESKENTSIFNSENSHVHVEIDSDCTSRINLSNSHLYESTIGTNKDDNNTASDLDFTNPVEHIELHNGKSLLMETVLPNTSYISKNTSNNIIYTNPGEENYINNISNNQYSQPCNVNSESNQTCVQNLSMQLTEAVPSLPLHFDIEKNVQKHDTVLHQDQFSTDSTTNYNDVSMEITQPIIASTKPIRSNLDSFREISVIQNCQNANHSIISNNYENVTRNLQLINTVSKPTPVNYDDVNYDDDSMKLTDTVQSFVRVANVCCSNNTRNNAAFNTSMELTTAISSETCERNILHLNDRSIVGESNWETAENTNKTEFFNDVPMEITKAVTLAPVSIYNKDLQEDEIISRDDRTIFFHNTSLDMTKPVSLNNRQQIVNFTCDSLSKDIYKEKNNKAAYAIIHDKENLRVNESILRNDKTMFFHNISMEMIEAESLKNKEDISDITIYKSLEKTHREKDTNRLISFDERTRFLNKSMEFTNAVSVPLCHEKTINTVHDTETLSQIMPNTHAPVQNSVGLPLETAAVASNKTVHNVSMEITAGVPTTLYHTQNIVNETKNLISSKNNVSRYLTINNTCKSSEETRTEKDTNKSIPFDERTRLLNKSMEFSNAVSVPLCHEKTINTVHDTETFSQIMPNTHVSVQNSVGLPLETTAVANNRTVHNISMEITAGVPTTLCHTQNIVNETKNLISSKNNVSRYLTINNTCKSSEETRKKEDTNKLIPFDERTRLLNKSMEFTNAISVPLCHEKTINTVHDTETFPQIMPNTHVSVQNSVGLPFETIAVASNKTVHNISMEMTAAVPTLLHHMQNIIVNETENLIGSKNNVSHCSTVNVTESRKSVTRENFAVSNRIMEITKVHDELNPHITLPVTDVDNDYSSNALLENITEKRTFCEDKNINSEKTHATHIEFQSTKKNNVHSSLKIDHNHPNDDAHDKNLAESNFSLNEINDSFLKKNLLHFGNNIEILESIQPPSFIEDENAFFDATRKDESQTWTATDIASVNNRLEPINAEHGQTKKCDINKIANNIHNNQETDCQIIVNSIINNNRINESNCNIMNIEELSGINTLLTDNVNYNKMVKIHSTNHFMEIETTNEDQMDEKEYVQEKEDEDVQDIEKKGRYFGKETSKIRNIDHIEKTKALIENQEIREKYCQENLNNGLNVQNMEHKERCANIGDKLHMAQCVNTIEKESLLEQDPFLSLLQKLEIDAKRDDCIWNVYHKNINKKMIVSGFLSNSLLIVIFLWDDLDCSQEKIIKDIKLISRLSDDAGVLIRIVHKLILEKINTEMLKHLYKTHDDIFLMLDFISQEVKLAMDFMFDLKRLDNLNLMEITCNEISFVSRSKRMDIILKITINIKCFDKLTPNDVNIRYLLGRVKETDVKNLIKNVKKDHKFLRRYMNDVKDYIDIIEETCI